MVRMASERGLQVRVLSRGEKKPEVQNLPGVEWFQGDVLDPASLDRAMEGVETVIHLVGIITEVGEATYERVHYEGTVHVVDAAKRAGIRRYLHMSALGTRPNAVSRYHQTKWKAEEYVRASGLDFTLFRPSIIYGEKDDFINRFAGIVRRAPVVPIIGTGKGKLQPIWVEDVGECYLQALEKEETIGETYELGGPDRYTLEEIIDLVMETLGKRRPKIHIPLPLMRINAFFLEKLLEEPPINRDQLIMLQEDNVCDPTRMRETFALRWLPLAEGIKGYLTP
jgi:NADH dehydrogenase